MSKTYHGGLLDLKYVVKHVCHEVGQKHYPCLVDMYCLYIGLVEIFGKGRGDRTGHRSDALLKYEKAEEKLISHVSAILGPNPYTGKVDSEQETGVTKKKEFNCN